jgi:CRP-like cAMP-binding protein
MPVDIDSPEGHIIRKMVPFSTMPSSIFKVICDKITTETAKSGAFLFKRGDTKKELVYLLKGEVSLEVDKLKMEVIKAGTESARFALAHQIPRKVNGVAKGTVQFLRLNSVYITTPDSAKQDTPKESGQSWVSSLLMIPILRALPPAQLAKISEHLEEVQYQEGEIVVKQGVVGTYYYLIKNGECVVSYKDATPEQTLTVTKLKMWDSFGAEALICDALRNHTVTALNKLSLLRIKKDRFLALIKEPLLKEVLDEAKTDALLRNNGILLDVRTAAEYEKSHLPEAINAPLLGLRNYLKHLDSRRPVAVISNQQDLSAAAAFLLLSYKFSASVSTKNAEFNSNKLTNNNTQHENHRYIAEDDTDSQGFFLDLFDTDQEQTEKLVISTRSVPTHSSSQDLLAAENASLKQQLKELQVRAEKSELEKQELMQKYQLLLKQSERLKVMLESMTK